MMTAVYQPPGFEGQRGNITSPTITAKDLYKIPVRFQGQKQPPFAIKDAGRKPKSLIKSYALKRASLDIPQGDQYIYTAGSGAAASAKYMNSSIN
jgi:hypothetical protein